jgi:hypothetical protein
MRANLSRSALDSSSPAGSLFSPGICPIISPWVFSMCQPFPVQSRMTHSFPRF